MVTTSPPQVTDGKVHPGNTLNDLTGKEWLKRTLSCFTLQVKPRSEDEKIHPAKYPPELCDRFIGLFTKKGQWVLDPFAGVGSTLVPARRTGRNAFGVELVPEFVKVAQNALRFPSLESHFYGSKQYIVTGDSRIIETILQDHGFTKDSFHLCMTSPPYWNMLRKFKPDTSKKTKFQQRHKNGLKTHYSNLDEDLENIDNYDVFLDVLTDIFVQIKPFITYKGHLVIVAQNLLNENQEMIFFAWDILYRLAKHFKPLKEQIWWQPDKYAGIWGYPTTYVGNSHHHYCLIFRNSK